MERKPYTGAVYTATCLVDGKVYVGKSVFGLKNRRTLHERKAVLGKGFKFHHALRKHGLENFVWSEYYLSDDNAQLMAVEKLLIAELKRENATLYNLTGGGEGVVGYIYTEEAKKKISEAGKGRVHSEEEKIKRANSLRGRVNGPMKPELKEKLRAVHLGSKHSPEHKAKIAASLVGRPVSPETRAKISAAKLGKPHQRCTEEHLQKFKNSRKGKTNSEEHRAKISASLKKRFALLREDSSRKNQEPEG
jgi:group I intron endonuclease